MSTTASAADVLQGVEDELDETLHLTNLAMGIPTPPLSFEDVATPMKLCGGQLALEVDGGVEPDYYRLGRGEHLEVAIWIAEDDGYLIRQAAPSMLREDVATGDVHPVHVDETPFAEEADGEA